MARTRISLSLEPREHERLNSAAARLRIPPATLAVQLIRNGLADMSGEEAPTAADALMRWLASYLDEVRDRGDWAADITIEVFERIEAEQSELYDAAKDEIGPVALNSSIGRFVRRRLGARVVTRDGHARIAKVPRGRTGLIKAATLLEPETEKPHDKAKTA